MIYNLAIVTTHPIQYNAPFFRLLSASDKLNVKVFYTWEKGAGQKYDPGFGKNIQWDIPLLDGYNYSFVKNTSKNPGSNHFSGIKNPSLVKEIKDFKPHAVLIYGWKLNSHLKTIIYFKGKIPVWFRGDSTLIGFEVQSLNNIFRKNNEISLIYRVVHFLKFQIRKFTLTFVYKFIDKAFYVGTNNKEYYLKHGLKENQLVWLPHAVDNEFFQKNEKDNEFKAQQILKDLSISENDYVVLFAGKLDHNKNAEILINSVIDIHQNKKTSTNIVLIIVGNGALETELKQKSKGYNFIHFMDFQNQSMMPVIYRLCNVYCLPSKGETWGLAVNEAMACGRPAIVSDKVGCAPDLIKEGETGYVFKSNIKVDLINKILNLSSKLNISKENCIEQIAYWNYNIDPILSELQLIK